MDAPYVVLIFSCGELCSSEVSGGTLDLWGVGGGGWFAKSFLGSMLKEKFKPILSKVGG